MNFFKPAITSITLLIVSVSVMTARPEDGAALTAVKSMQAIESDNPPAWWNPEVDPETQSGIGIRVAKLLNKLNLQDTSQSEKVRQLLTEHYSRVWAWHQSVDPKLDTAWREWDRARDSSNGKTKDELKALAIMTEVIDPIYAEFSPQIHRLLTSLNQCLGETETIRLLDIITRSPGVDRTYKAYLDMIPELSESEKLVLRNRLEQARTESLAAWSDSRIIKIFKKHKVRNEFSIDYFGYGYRERYSAWTQSLKN